MHITPKNGMYLCTNDKSNYNDAFAKNYNLLYGETNCINCDSCQSSLITPTITFIVTENCNLNCTYCYEKHKTCKKMSKEIAKKAIDFITSEDIKSYFPNAKGYIVEFFGGEPFLEVEIMEYIINYFNERMFDKDIDFLQNTMFSTTSNGTLYFDEKSQKFLNKHGKKFSMGITIDGNQKLHDSCRIFHDGKGSYEIVAKSIKHWMEKTTTNNETKVTIAHENIDEIFNSFVHLWEDLDIQFISSNCVFEDVWQPGDDQRLYDQLIKVADYLVDNDLYTKYYTSFFDDNIGQVDEKLDTNPCGGNGRMLAIGTDGKLYPCVRFMNYTLTKQEERCIGDIFNGINMDDPWLNELKNVTLFTQSEQKCLDCKISSGCSLCTGFNYDEFGTPNKRATYICDMHYARVCATAYFWNKLYSKLGLNKVFQLNVEDKFKR